jgi:hypothetical protein
MILNRAKRLVAQLTSPKILNNQYANLKREMDSSRLLSINLRKYIPTIDCIFQINALYAHVYAMLERKRQKR